MKLEDYTYFFKVWLLNWFEATEKGANSTMPIICVGIYKNSRHKTYFSEVYQFVSTEIGFKHPSSKSAQSFK